MKIQPIPDLSLPDLDGVFHFLDAFPRRIVVVNFWSAECPWVQRTDELLLPWLARWGERVALVCIAANAGEPEAALRDVARRRGIPLLLRDPFFRATGAFEATNTPHYYVFDEQGLLRYQGAFDDVTFRQRIPTRFFLYEAVEALLAGREPMVKEMPPYGCTILRG